MRSKEAQARLAAANPISAALLDETLDAAWGERLLEGVLDYPVTPARRSRPRRPARLLLIALAALVLTAVPAYAIGRGLVDWLSAEPAPPEVVSDFGNYAPQLGFNPHPGKAVLVAEDSSVRLFVTTNKQGTYCFIVSTRADGGTCVSQAVASAPLVAGYVSDVPTQHGEFRLLVVVGKVADPAARSVSFAAPDGTSVRRPTGAGGFFVAGIEVSAETNVCANGSWAPSFTFYGADGNRIDEQTLLLAASRGEGTARGCGAGFFALPRPH